MTTSTKTKRINVSPPIISMTDSPLPAIAPKRKPPHQFKPGESGNPAGRAVKQVSITKYLRSYLSYHPSKVKSLTKALVDAGIKGNMMP